MTLEINPLRTSGFYPLSGIKAAPTEPSTSIAKAPPTEKERPLTPRDFVGLEVDDTIDKEARRENYAKILDHFAKLPREDRPKVVYIDFRFAKLLNNPDRLINALNTAKQAGITVILSNDRPNGTNPLSHERFSQAASGVAYAGIFYDPATAVNENGEPKSAREINIDRLVFTCNQMYEPQLLSNDLVATAILKEFFGKPITEQDIKRATGNTDCTVKYRDQDAQIPSQSYTNYGKVPSYKGKIVVIYANAREDGFKKDDGTIGPGGVEHISATIELSNRLWGSSSQGTP